ncbi:MAG: ATP-binding cassette domain-containing protein [Trueperaceae bacterium]
MTAVAPVQPGPAAVRTPPTTDAVVRCRGLVKRYGAATVVDGLSLTIAPGEAYGLLGPNGAGKTTTISMLVGLLAPDAGEVEIAGHRLADAPAAFKGAVGYVPQDLALYGDLTARENLVFFGRLYGLSGRALADRVRAVLDQVGLADRADDRTETFSGGMKRRVNIAAALLHEPELLVLDEPTVGVDPQSRTAILDGIADLNADGMAVLYTSHYMEEVERLCDRIGIVDRGRMIAEGSRRELVERLDQADRIVLEVDGDAEALARACADVPGVRHVAHGHRQVTLMVGGGRSALPQVFARAADAGVAVTGAHVVEPDLEAVFLHLTGKALRDGA